ncbi:hypothetical protein Tco_1493986 [Tanacetum coccineum]
MIVMTLMTKLESLFGPLFDEYLNGENQVVSKSFVVTTADASDKCQQQSDSTSSTSTPGPIVTAGAVIVSLGLVCYTYGLTLNAGLLMSICIHYVGSCCEFCGKGNVDAFVDGRSYLLSGATNSSEANGIIRNPKLELESFCFTFDLVPFSCGKRLVHGDDVAKIVFRMRNGHVQVYGYAFWVNQCTSGFHGVNEPGGVRVAREDDRGDTEGREDVHEVFQQRGSYLDVEGIKWSRWMKLFSEYGFKAKYHLGKENVVVESWSRKKSEAKNEFWIDCGLRFSNWWSSMKKNIASCGSKYLAYSRVEVEYQGSSGLLLQPELSE